MFRSLHHCWNDTALCATAWWGKLCSMVRGGRQCPTNMYNTLFNFLGCHNYAHILASFSNHHNSVRKLGGKQAHRTCDALVPCPRSCLSDWRLAEKSVIIAELARERPDPHFHLEVGDRPHECMFVASIDGSDGWSACDETTADGGSAAGGGFCVDVDDDDDVDSLCRGSRGLNAAVQRRRQHIRVSCNDLSLSVSQSPQTRSVAAEYRSTVCTFFQTINTPYSSRTFPVAKMHCLTMSSQHHPSTWFSISWKLLCSGDRTTL